MPSEQTYKIREFMRAINQPVRNYPEIPTPQEIKLRCSLVAEETFELLEASFPGVEIFTSLKSIVLDAIKKQHVRDAPHMVGVADAVADILYVTIGTNVTYGIDGDAVFDLVHQANMKKVSGPTSPEGKRLKPEGWTPPDIGRELMRQRLATTKWFDLTYE
jgi:predicted HAD superfamily Cof-like phosphohydrolase